MTNGEKLELLKTSIAPDTDTDPVLTATLEQAEALILNRMYPFGYEDGVVIPRRYERIQVALAVELYTHRGAEGQMNHSENGTSRYWPEKSHLLHSVIPHVGSVISNA